MNTSTSIANSLSESETIQAREEPSGRTVWYMRDNHTFRRMSPNIELSLLALREEFDEGYTCGMLCTKGGPMYGTYVHAHGKSKWEEFAASAREWLPKAFEPSAAEIEWQSWLALL